MRPRFRLWVLDALGRRDEAREFLGDYRNVRMMMCDYHCIVRGCALLGDEVEVANYRHLAQLTHVVLIVIEFNADTHIVMPDLAQ